MNCSHQVLSNYTHQEMSAYTHINMTICQKSKDLSCAIQNSNNKTANVFRILALVAAKIACNLTRTVPFQKVFVTSYRAVNNFSKHANKIAISLQKITVNSPARTITKATVYRVKNTISTTKKNIKSFLNSLKINNSYARNSLKPVISSIKLTSSRISNTIKNDFITMLNNTQIRVKGAAKKASSKISSLTNLSVINDYTKLILSALKTSNSFIRSSAKNKLVAAVDNIQTISKVMNKLLTESISSTIISAKSIFKLFTTLYKINDPNSNTGLIAYYPFDADVNDYSGNDNNGTNYAVTFSEEGSAVFSRSSSGSLKVPNVVSYLTINFWMNFSSSGNAGLQTTLFNQNTQGTGQEFIMIGVDPSGVPRNFFVQIGTVGNSYGNFSFPGVFDYDTWTNITLVFETSTKHVIAYKNGEFFASVTTTTVLPSTTPTSGDMYIGSYQNSATYSFTGEMRDVKFYNRMLTRDEVNLLYESSSTKKFIYKNAQKNSLIDCFAFAYNFIKEASKNTFEAIINVLSGDSKLTSKSFLGFININILKSQETSLNRKLELQLTPSIADKIVFKITNSINIMQANIQKEVGNIVINTSYKISAAFEKISYFKKNIEALLKLNISTTKKAYSEISIAIMPSVIKNNIVNKNQILSGLKQESRDNKSVNKNQTAIYRIYSILNGAWARVKEIIMSYKVSVSAFKNTGKAFELSLFNLTSYAKSINKNISENIQFLNSKISAIYKNISSTYSEMIEKQKRVNKNSLANGATNVERGVTDIYANKGSEYKTSASFAKSKLLNKIISAITKITCFFEVDTVFVIVKQIVSHFKQSSSIRNKYIRKYNFAQIVNTLSVQKAMKKSISAISTILDNATKGLNKLLDESLLNIMGTREKLVNKVINAYNTMIDSIKSDIFKNMKSTLLDYNVITKVVGVFRTIIISITNNKTSTLDICREVSYTIKSVRISNVLKAAFSNLVTVTTKSTEVVITLFVNVIKFNQKMIKGVGKTIKQNNNIISQNIKFVQFILYAVTNLLANSIFSLTVEVFSYMISSTSRSTQMLKNNASNIVNTSIIHNRYIEKINVVITNIANTIAMYIEKSLDSSILKIKQTGLLNVSKNNLVDSIKFNVHKIVQIDKISIFTISLKDYISKYITKLNNNTFVSVDSFRVNQTNKNKTSRIKIRNTFVKAINIIRRAALDIYSYAEKMNDKLVNTVITISNSFNKTANKIARSSIKTMETIQRLINKNVLVIDKFIVTLSTKVIDVKHIFYVKLRGAWKDVTDLYVKVEEESVLKWKKVVEVFTKEDNEWKNR